jgi:hypothetical protein
LHARPLDSGDELRLLSGEPVVFFHFSGFDARRPDRLCGHPMRLRLSEHPRRGWSNAGISSSCASRTRFRCR